MNTNKKIKVVFDFDKFEYKEIEKDAKWRVTSDITTTIILDDRETFIYDIKDGFETNFRSGPRWLDAIVDRIGEPPIAMSWLIHDANYEGYLSRSKADKLLFYMLLEAGVENTPSQIIYIGLQIFGGFNYGNKRDNLHIEFTHHIKPRTLEAITRDLNDTMVFDSQNMEEVKEELMKIAAAEGKQISETTIEKYYK